jgi:exopolyphosphatase/guanosine-5'-triphosphate,3'-diphosphate pyrophosphatase
MDRVAIVDLGTNTFNLLVAEKRHGKLHVLYSEDVGVGLGKGGIENGAIAPDAFKRGIETLIKFKKKAAATKADSIRGFGTSMLRNASNGKQFLTEALDSAGIPISIIKGKDEAGYIIEGVWQAVEFGKRPSLVIDIGGGSTEFIFATKDAILWKHSFEIGTTRLLERIGLSDPFSMSEQLRMSEHIETQLGMLWGAMEKHHPNVLVGSAGSFDTIAEMIASRKGQTIGENQISLNFLPDDFRDVMVSLLTIPRSERESFPGLPSYRVDTIIPSLLIIDTVIQKGISQVSWSRYSLKEGAAWRALSS